LHLEAWIEYSGMVHEFIQKGGRFFRMMMAPSAMGIEFEEVGNYQKRQNFAWEMDQIIRLCEKTNTLVSFNMMYQNFFAKAGGYYAYRFDYANFWPDKNAWPYKDPNPPSGYS